MNIVPALDVFAALLKARGQALAFPGGAPRVSAAVDADLLARAIDWAGSTISAKNRVFNLTNGDLYTWEQLWPALADQLGMDPGTAMPRSVHKFCSPQQNL